VARTRRILALCLPVLLLCAAAAEARPLLGFNGGWAPGQVGREVGLTKRFGATTNRLQIYWATAQPSRSTYNWYTTDLAYQAMTRAGQRPLIDVVSAPRWTTGGCHDIYRCQQTPAHDVDYQRFLRTVVLRYPHALAIELGQEPNLANWSKHPSAARYTQMLKAGYRAVKKARRSLPVLTGSTCCTTAHGGGDIGSVDFLSQMYAHGAKGYFDAIGFHVYVGGTIPTVGPDIQVTMQRMRAVRDAHGDRRPFWITEVGFSSHGRSPWSSAVFSPRSQALSEAIAYRTLAAMRDVRSIYFYMLRDKPLSPGEPATDLEPSMGFFRTNFRAKPAVWSLLSAIGHR
jgi:hypothetical protein